MPKRMTNKMGWAVSSLTRWPVEPVDPLNKEHFPIETGKPAIWLTGKPTNG